MREFSDDYLARAGRPTPELIADALAVNNYSSLDALIEKFYRETCTMVYGYAAWPKVIARNVDCWRDQEYWHAMDGAVRAELQDPPPVAKAALANWQAHKEKALDAAESRNNDAILATCGEWQQQALQVHDDFMNYAAVLLSEVVRRFGEQAVQQVLTEIMNPESMGILPEMPFRQRVEKLVGFTRLHLLPFRLVEDDEKATFIASPCPSGGRQLLAGLYEQGRPGEIIRGESALTYGLPELPAYCCHEPALEQASILRFGSPAFIVEPSAQLGRLPCHVHVYKDPATIPDRFFERVGLTREGDLIASSS